MGYNIRTGLVEKHAKLLQRIYIAVAVGGGDLRFDCSNPDDMNAQRYQLLRILRATRLLKDECDGLFVDLHSKVKICEDWDLMAVIVRPVTAHRSSTVLTPYRENEHDVLERLKQFEGQMDLVHFLPTPEFSAETWQIALQTIGFNLVPNPDDPDSWIGGPVGDEGEVDYAVARMTDKTPSGFALLSAFEKSGDMSQDG
ncbi:hypothetical protein LCGC14_0251790 [marine sediment metagenome]|uniref:Uncharacterized protein n=1 Tax=marine sediment metagenome TaxID=412755 RepID=A0A0F9UKZ3_9ZZZZ